MNAVTKIDRRARLLLLVLAILPFFSLLGLRGLNEPDEGRYTEIAREMLETGDWITPRIKGVPHYAKPPWIYWCIASSLGVFGHHEWAARLPSAIAAAIATLAVFGIGRRLASPRAGLIAAAILATSAEFFALSQIITTDMMLCATVCVALWAHTEWRLGPRRDWRKLSVFWLALSIGFLDKGPVPIAVVMLTLSGFAIATRSLATLRGLGWIWGPALALGPGIAWYLAVCRADPALWEFFLGDELVDRVAAGRGRAKPVYYFLIVLPLATLPWTAVIAWASVILKKRHAKTAADLDRRAFLLAWILMPFALFSLSSSKLWTYLLPVMPALALVAGIALDEALRNGRDLPSRLEIAMGLLLPPWGLLRLAGARKWRHSTSSKLVGFVVLALVVFQSLQFLASRHETKLGNNAGFETLIEALPPVDWVGARIPDGLTPSATPPVFPGDGVIIVSYRFRFMAAAFYALRGRAEYLPNYGGDSLWEQPSRRFDDYPASRRDLVDLLRSERSVVVLTKARYTDDLEEAAGMSLRILARARPWSSRSPCAHEPLIDRVSRCRLYVQAFSHGSDVCSRWRSIRQWPSRLPWLLTASCIG